jgi:hypothetical protein
LVLSLKNTLDRDCLRFFINLSCGSEKSLQK